MRGLQFLSFFLCILVRIHCLVNYLLPLVMDQKLAEVPVVVTLHLPEENVALRVLRLFEQEVVEELQHLATYGRQLVLDLLSVHLDQVNVFVSLNKISGKVNASLNFD